MRRCEPNRVFETYDDILDADCEAWNNLADHPEKTSRRQHISSKDSGCKQPFQ